MRINRTNSSKKGRLRHVWLLACRLVRSSCLSLRELGFMNRIIPQKIDCSMYDCNTTFENYYITHERSEYHRLRIYIFIQTGSCHSSAVPVFLKHKSNKTQRASATNWLADTPAALTPALPASRASKGVSEQASVRVYHQHPQMSADRDPREQARGFWRRKQTNTPTLPHALCAALHPRVSAPL